jgi:hypothetical protein
MIFPKDDSTVLQRSHINLLLYHADSGNDGALVLHPNAEFYARRLLAILFLGFATAVLWACTIETPWQWEARREREEARRQAKWEQTEAIGDPIQELRGFSGGGNPRRPAVPPAFTNQKRFDSLAKQENAPASEWQLRVPAWLQSTTALSVLIGLHLLLGLLGNRVVLWRDADDGIWMRFWSLWPRKRFVGIAAATRLVPRIMQMHEFNRSGGLRRVRWLWVLQVTSDLVPEIPASPGQYLLTWRSFLPSFVVGDQPDEPLPEESPPRVVQQWIQKIASQLGIPVEPLRTTPQQVSFSQNGRSLVRRETGTISIPISRTPGTGGRRET